MNDQSRLSYSQEKSTFLLYYILVLIKQIQNYKWLPAVCDFHVTAFLSQCNYHGCATCQTKLWLSPPVKHRRNPWAPTLPVFDYAPWLACLESHSRFANQFERKLGAQNKEFGATLQTLLTGIKLRLWRRQATAMRRTSSFRMPNLNCLAISD